MCFSTGSGKTFDTIPFRCQPRFDNFSAWTWKSCLFTDSEWGRLFTNAASSVSQSPLRCVAIDWHVWWLWKVFSTSKNSPKHWIFLHQCFLQESWLILNHVTKNSYCNSSLQNRSSTCLNRSGSWDWTTQVCLQFWIPQITGLKI